LDCIVRHIYVLLTINHRQIFNVTSMEANIHDY
jgi:hypothetical protein